MSNAYSMEDLLDFLSHASDRGILPAATSTALAVATRTVLGVLGDEERKDLRKLDLDDAIKRFHNKRAKDFSPGSLKEYGRRLHRAVKLFLDWRASPADFSVKTRATTASKGKKRKGWNDKSGRSPEMPSTETGDHDPFAVAFLEPGGNGYRSAFPVRPGIVVGLSNIPTDLTTAEAERLAQFIRMLVVE